MRFDAILFDCDGVLVDSEPIVNRVLRDMLAERGWVLTAEECWSIFVGKAVKDERLRIEQHTGQPLTEEWLAGFRARRNAALEAELSVIANAQAAVHEVHARHDARIACASGADRHKVELQLRKVGLLDYFAGRIFSGHEMPRSKPHPDVYLAAAAALAASPQRCAVVEDTLTGVAAGVAAGATVFAYVPQGDAEVFRRAGAVEVFRDMAQLPDVLR
ncbi:HAD family phosphatase [Rhodoferax sp.]|uniref:HAD family hydrolase n=1 Tax=Rhodoferax sp. TaxID=50421 RepID=UPI00273160B3|nr:HAD family phosphatase [Rhodoferax sp.]MDP1655380.1 HAD family phosphatase [Hylemonella sp.]MDP1945465.1 HAD family phosphatase [Rhodoferax sp.]